MQGRGGGNWMRVACDGQASHPGGVAKQVGNLNYLILFWWWFFVQFWQIIRELREEVDRLKRMLAAKIAGKSHIVEPGETTIEIKEMLSESEKLMSECTMTWEQKEKQTEKIQQVHLWKLIALKCHLKTVSWVAAIETPWLYAHLFRPFFSLSYKFPLSLWLRCTKGKQPLPWPKGHPTL